MRGTYSLVFLIATVSAATHFRLNTNENTQLNVGDALISTLGLFRATLLQSQCTLYLETFNGNNGYTYVGNYTPSNSTGNCNYLMITNGQVQTDSNLTYMYVGPSYNMSTILTIDDWGVIRLIGTYQLPDFQHQVSNEFNVTTFTKNQTFIFPVSQYGVSFIDTFPTITNNRNWQFSAGLGQFQITQSGNAGLVVNYAYSVFTVNNSVIEDFTSTTFPGCIFPNITYVPRCLEPRLYLDFKPPYVLVLDPFWPIATVYEQGRYKVLQISFGHQYQPYAWQDERRLLTRNEPSPCPPYTFQFRGSCVTKCPSPYFYQMRSQNGYCVLTCEQYTPQNDTSRICSCYQSYEEQAISSLTVQACPQNALSYPYGCYCNNSNLYFDRLLTFSCVSTCPQRTYASNSLCMNCPIRCLTCQLDGLYRSYLQCIACESGFSVVNGKCWRTCSPGLGLSLVGGTCQQCSDPNCLNCTQNLNICTRCDLLYALSNGVCVQNCVNNTQLAFSEYFNSECMVLDQTCSSAFPTYYKTQPLLKCIACLTNTYLYANICVNQCPTNFTSNVNNYCVCSTSGTITVDNQCLSMPVCPIKMGWDPPSSSCLSCDYGCLTCYDIACTSCYPGYFLYISPQGVRCRRESPLYTCDQQYSWMNGACVLTTYSNPMYLLASCLSSVPNCLACYPNSIADCAICNQGYYNVNNTCIANCPNNTIPYEGLTCIYPEVDNCQIPFLQVKYQPTIINYNRIDNSDPYLFYLFNGLEQPDDPAGYIPIYQNLTTRKTDGLFRDSQFFQPIWTCLKCQDGFGLSADFSQCIPCPDPCVTCYMAQNNSCLTSNNNSSAICHYYIDYATGNCIQNCSSASYIPYITNGILYCYPYSQAPTKNILTIDSSVFTSPNGSTNVFFVLNLYLPTSQSTTLPILTQATAPKVSDSVNGGSSNTLNGQFQNGYVYLMDPDPNNDLWILNVTGYLQTLAGSSNIVLSNTVYGVGSEQGHSQFMKTWLAYIGYLLGIVLICLHVVFIGNDMLYKVDNTLILAQSIYFFSFVQLLVGELLAQFYYGWLFASFGFFPNFFINTIPSNYVELAAPNSYKLATVDTNIIRNAGWAFSLLLVFFAAYGLITFGCWVMSTLFNKTDVWHPRIATNSLIGGIQFLSMSIFYWAVANLLYIGNSSALSSSFSAASKGVSIGFIILITIYSIIRWNFNRLGGLYMFKRILIATILAASYLKDSMLAPLIIMEVVFCILRYLLEKPERYGLIVTMVIESLIHIGTYLLLFLCLSAGVNTIIISIIIFILIVVLSYGLTEIYLQSRNQWLIAENDILSSGINIVPAEKKKTEKMEYETQ